MLGLFGIGQVRQQIKCRKALAGRGNIVIRAFHDHHGHIGDRAEIHLLARHHELVARNLAVLEDPLHGGQIEFRRHVHDREILVIKAVVRVEIRGLAPRDAQDLLAEGLGMAFGVHRDEALQLEKAR